MNELIAFGKTMQILYVEDNEDSRIQTRKMLSNFFANITVAEDGKEGLEKYMSHHKETNKYYDLIVTDINMPNMNGIEMIGEIFKHNPLQSIIITSAHNEVEHLSSAIELGVSGFITKPINTDQLIKTLYKASQAVFDHQIVTKYAKEIQELELQA
jgi:CheY-like chemotaxis protein